MLGNTASLPAAAFPGFRGPQACGLRYRHSHKLRGRASACGRRASLQLRKEPWPTAATPRTAAGPAPGASVPQVRALRRGTERAITPSRPGKVLCLPAPSHTGKTKRRRALSLPVGGRPGGKQRYRGPVGHGGKERGCSASTRGHRQAH